MAHVSLRDLKNLRSTSKQFSDLTDPILFRTIVLVPCAAGFNVITALPHPDRISWHVRRLIYDDRWPDVACRIRDNLQAHPFDSINPVVKARLLQTLGRLTQLTRSFKEDTSSEVAFFKQVLDFLPSLRAVSVLSTHEHDKSAKLPRFYSRICSNALCDFNKASLPPRGPQQSESGRSALLAIGQSGKHITEIEMNGLSWPCMFASPSQQGVWPADVFATVRRLDLSFGYTQHDLLIREKSLLAKLGPALAQAIHLECLSLDFGDTAQDDVDDVDEVDDFDGRSWCMLSALFPAEHQYSDLKELGLRNFCFSESGLLAFIDRHSSTIKALRLNSVELVAARRSESPCWRRVFIHVQSALNLHQVQLQDGLYLSGGGVRISMHPKPEERFPGCLLDQVEQFILHGGECPIRAGCHDLEWNDLNGLGDESWAFF